VFIVGWLVIFADITGVLVPVEDNIGHFAHLGGYLAIAFLVFIFSRGDRSRVKKGLLINLGMLVLLVLAYYYLGNFLPKFLMGQ
jgi:VanZ family protein